MKKILRIALVFVTISFMFSCEDNELYEIDKAEIKQKLNSLEQQIIVNENLKKNNTIYTIDETYTTVNSKDSTGLYFFTNFIEDVDYMIESDNYTESEIQSFIEDETGSLTINEVPEDIQAEISEMIIDSYMSISEDMDVIGISKQYEQFVNENISDENIKELCYRTISLKKWAEFRYYNNTESQNKFEPCAYRSCFDCCMLRTYEGYNTIDWIHFAVDPVGDTGWNSTSCAWQCL